MLDGKHIENGPILEVLQQELPDFSLASLLQVQSHLQYCNTPAYPHLLQQILQPLRWPEAHFNNNSIPNNAHFQHNTSTYNYLSKIYALYQE